jgi:hypothetical protein
MTPRFNKTSCEAGGKFFKNAHEFDAIFAPAKGAKCERYIAPV